MVSNPSAEREALWQKVKAAHDATDALREHEAHDQPGHDAHHQMKIGIEKLVAAENALAAFDAEHPDIAPPGTL